MHANLLLTYFYCYYNYYYFILIEILLSLSSYKDNLFKRSLLIVYTDGMWHVPFTQVYLSISPLHLSLFNLLKLEENGV